MAGNQLEYFLIRTLCLKPENRSLRRLKLFPCRLALLNIEEPSERTDKMLVLPHSSLRCFIGDQPSFSNLFYALDDGYGNYNPTIDTVTQFKTEVIENNGQDELQLTRTVSTPERGDIKQVNTCTVAIQPEMNPLLKTDCIITYTTGHSFTYRSAGHEFHFSRVNQAVYASLSDKPMHVFVAALHHYHSACCWPKDNEHLDSLAEVLAICIRQFQLELDLKSKRACALRYREVPDRWQPHLRSLLESRLEVVQVLIEYWEGPLRVIAEDKIDEENQLDWLENLRENHSQIKYLLAPGHIPNLNPEQLFTWRLCSPQQSSTTWWRQQFKLHSLTKLQELALKTQAYVLSKSEHLSILSLLTIKAECSFGRHLVNLIERFNSLVYRLTLPVLSHMKETTTTSTSRKTSDSGTKIINKSMLTRSSAHVDAFLLPRRNKMQKSTLQTAKNGYLLLGNIGASEWSYQFFTKNSVEQSIFATVFELFQPNVWVCKGSILWSDTALPEAGVPTSWDAYELEFTLEKTFLLCSQSTQLIIMTFDHVAQSDDKNRKILAVPSPIPGVDDLTFTSRVQYFYNDHHDPSRSQTFRLFESRKLLLWAVLILSSETTVDWFYDFSLVLTAFSVTEGGVTQRMQHVTRPETVWLYKGPDLRGKSEMDLRQNVTVNLHFSWREVTGRVLGVWLRDQGGYRVYAVKHDRFLLCAQRQSSPFTHHYMAELLPSAPGMVAVSPMVFRRNNTLRVLEKGFSYEIFELRLKLN